jgi:ATP-binding protein involved in chromosome partitioning
MFEKVGVPILGLVENMSTHVCSNCGHEEAIFGAGGAQRMVADFGTELLGSLPLDIRIREQTDSGCPTVEADPEGTLAEAYRKIARQLIARVAQRSENLAARFPKIVVQNT